MTQQPPPIQKHGIDVVPPTNHASPHGVLPADIDGVERWWRPTWGDTLTQLGWRWMWFTPAIALIMASVILIPLRPTYVQLLFTFWKPILVAVALPTGMFIRATKSLVRDRKDPFCIHCGYSLVGHTDGQRCPECGRTISFAVCEEYRRDPDWFIARWRQRHEIPMRDMPFEAGAIRQRTTDGT